MNDPNQIRINELARELEVKAKAIIDYLPEAGVTEKKTHSSSIELAAAEKVRKHFRDLADAEAAADAAAAADKAAKEAAAKTRSEEHTSELQSRLHLVCRLLLEKKKKITVARPEESK